MNLKQEDTKLLQTITKGQAGAVVWVGDRCYKLFENGLWYRWNESKGRPKTTRLALFPPKTGLELVDFALDYINQTGFGR